MIGFAVRTLYPAPKAESFTLYYRCDKASRNPCLVAYRLVWWYPARCFKEDLVSAFLNFNGIRLI